MVAAFVEPPWEAPLDVEACLAAIAPEAAIAGMFFLALQEGALRRGVALAFARPRYLAFGFYPVAEFAPLLVTAAGLFYPEQSLREGLRRIGRVGPVALLGSTLGKVTLGASEGAQAAVTAIAKTYSINVRSSRCEIVETKPRSMILKLSSVPHFLDSHHVGVFEGTLDYARVDGHVRIRSHGVSSADLLLSW